MWCIHQNLSPLGFCFSLDASPAAQDGIRTLPRASWQGATGCDAMQCGEMLNLEICLRQMEGKHSFRVSVILLGGCPSCSSFEGDHDFDICWLRCMSMNTGHLYGENAWFVEIWDVDVELSSSSPLSSMEMAGHWHPRPESMDERIGVPTASQQQIPTLGRLSALWAHDDWLIIIFTSKSWPQRKIKGSPLFTIYPLFDSISSSEGFTHILFFSYFKIPKKIHISHLLSYVHIFSMGKFPAKPLDLKVKTCRPQGPRSRSCAWCTSSKPWEVRGLPALSRGWKEH